MEQHKLIIAVAIVAVAIAVSAAILIFNRGMSKSKSAVELTKEGKAILIDVRTDDEWSAGHAAPAAHFELARLESGELPPVPKDSVIYVYCRSGVRAGQAKTILEQNGFVSVINLGGLKDWQAMGGAVIK